MKDEGYYDLAVFLAEQSAQLLIKAYYYKWTGYSPRGHGLRNLLAGLSNLLDRTGLREASYRIHKFTHSNREILLLLEESYTWARYADSEYTREDSESALRLVEKLEELFEDIDNVIGQ